MIEEEGKNQQSELKSLIQEQLSAQEQLNHQIQEVTQENLSLAQQCEELKNIIHKRKNSGMIQLQFSMAQLDASD